MARHSSTGCDDGDTGGSGGGRRGIGRRSFVRAAATTAVGVGAIGAASGTAAAGPLKDGKGERAEAPNDFPRVSTRDHFDDDANLINGESTWSYDVEGSWPGSWGEDTLTLLVHGWLSSDEDDQDIDGGYELKLGLEKYGYSGDTAVFTWDSDKGDSWDYGWHDAKEIAERNGRKLANFSQWYSRKYGVNVRWVAHSLGARVALFGMKSLHEDYGHYKLLDSVSLVGGAVEEDDVSTDAGWWDSEYGQHIEYATQELNNFHASDDEVLEWIYETREWDEAAGLSGGDSPLPYNYTDYDVTDVVPTHYDYLVRDYGCISEVVRRW
ncbi:DUF726 domain-containing protein [Halobacteriales archaeon QS_8_69_26]|nr:MAG: DUF726 domain-containing protein [Halobacteriales archaeon QS_8_69_26]